MTVVAPAAAIHSRIATIRARLDPRLDASHALLTAELPVTAPPPAGFDPFGQVYRDAVAAARLAPGATSPTTGAGASDLAGATPRATASPFAFLGTPSAVAASSAIGAGQQATPMGGSVGQIGGYGRLEPPAELAGYGNGRVQTEMLAPIGQGSHRLHAPAAAAWRAAVQAAAAEGIDLRITDSYRDYAEQVDLVRRKGLHSQGGLGATPGTSNHGWGLAVDADVTDARTLDWMRANAWQFGFVEAVPREPWHWEFRPAQA